mgnify:CR=1 FL=1
MRIGIPREIKPAEGRIALIPAACGELAAAGHEVFVESGAGEPSGYADTAFAAAGATVLPDAATLYERGELIVKVKEPVAGDLALLRPHHRLFCFLHLAAAPALGERLREIGLTAVAFETLEEGGGLPLLAPMSDIAGRLAVQVGSQLLLQHMGGRGVLLGGVAGTTRGLVVVVGAGHVGLTAARLAAAMGAQVTVFDKRRDRLEAARAIGPNVTGLQAFGCDIAQAVAHADLVVGAVLVPGRHAPRVVTREMVRAMHAGSVIADVSVDQGGCVETTRPTTYADGAYTEEGVLHFTVTNMPGAVPRTSSQALSAVLVPYVLRLAADDWAQDPALVTGINVRDGEYVHPGVREELSRV